MRELRAVRLKEQGSLAAAEAQCSRLAAALSCTEDDLAVLRSTLEQEIRRAEQWQVGRSGSCWVGACALRVAFVCEGGRGHLAAGGSEMTEGSYSARDVTWH